MSTTTKKKAQIKEKVAAPVKLNKDGKPKKERAPTRFNMRKRYIKPEKAVKNWYTLQEHIMSMTEEAVHDAMKYELENKCRDVIYMRLYQRASVMRRRREVDNLKKRHLFPDGLKP